jgi:hypothetical protein
VLAELRIAQLSADQRRQGVVLTMPQAAGVRVDLGLDGFTVDDGGLVGRVAHS